MTNAQEDVSVEVSRAGTSAGFKKFLVKENGTDFNDASRQIKDEEAAEAEDLGIEVKEFKVALDGLTFVINKDNDWAKEMTPEQLISIFKGAALQNGRILTQAGLKKISKQWDRTKTTEHTSSSMKTF